MRRRHYLASTAALLAGSLAGCAHPNAVLRMDAVSDVELAEHASRMVDGQPEYRDLVAGAVENGSATASGRSPPLETDQPVAYEGRYYELTATETGRRERTEYDVTVDYDPGTETPGGEAVDYADLPEVDRATMDALLPPPEDRPENEGPDRGVSRTYSEAEAAASVLVPEQEYEAVVYEGERYPVAVGDGRTVTTYEYRYEAERIAGSAAEYGASVREEHAFTLSGLSDAEREVVEAAIDDGYYEGSADDAFSSVASRFRDHPGYETDEWGGNWVVRYEGTVYWADLQHPPGAVEG